MTNDILKINIQEKPIQPISVKASVAETIV
jgi:hypothetical protein